MKLYMLSFLSIFFFFLFTGDVRKQNINMIHGNYISPCKDAGKIFTLTILCKETLCFVWLSCAWNGCLTACCPVLFYANGQLFLAYCFCPDYLFFCFPVCQLSSLTFVIRILSQKIVAFYLASYSTVAEW